MYINRFFCAIMLYNRDFEIITDVVTYLCLLIHVIQLFLVRRWFFWVFFSYFFDYFIFRWICSMVSPVISVFEGRMWVYIILNFTDIVFMRFCRVFFGVNLVLVIWSAFSDQIPEFLVFLVLNCLVSVFFSFNWCST